MNRKYDLVIMDFHGTMTDHQLRAVRSYHAASKAVTGEGLPRTFYQEVLTRPSQRRGNGQTNKEFIEQRFDHLAPDEMTLFMDVFGKTMKDTYIPIPGLKPAMRELRRIGTELVLLSNGPNREQIINTLKKWGFPDLSDRLYSGHLSGVKKPDPRSVDYIFKDLEEKGIPVVPAKTLMVGDYADDVKAAHSVGADSALIVRGAGQETFPVREPRPTYIITMPQELVQIVRGERAIESRNEVTINPVLWPKEGWYYASAGAAKERV